MISVLFAILTSLSNGSATVFQRRAAATAPDEQAMHLSLIRTLLRRKDWLGGMALVIVAAVCQAVALATGPISLVQPIFVIELPATLLIAGLVMRARLGRTEWLAVVAMTGGLALALATGDPGGGRDTVDAALWPIGLGLAGGFIAVLILFARGVRGGPRAAALALAAACAYALTAALMKDAMGQLTGSGVVELFTSWQLYALAVAGLGALFLLQNALQAGPLIAAQPMLTLGDALISVAFGVTLFEETVRTGWWFVPQVAGLCLIGWGCVVLSRSPLAAGTEEPTREGTRPAPDSTAGAPEAAGDRSPGEAAD